MKIFNKKVFINKVSYLNGNRRNIPQPLLPAEIGICNDTGQVFIGVDPETDSSVVVEIYDDYRNNQIIDEGLYTSDFREIAAGILSGFIFYTEFEIDGSGNIGSNSFTSHRVFDLNGDFRRSFIAFTSTSIPITESQATAIIGYPAFGFSSLGATFETWEEDFSSLTGFNYLDAGGIAMAINSVYSGYFSDVVNFGLVKVRQNKEIETSASEHVLGFEQTYKMAEVSIAKTSNDDLTVFVDTGIIFNYADARNYNVEYSVSNNETAYEYRRKGLIRIALCNLDAALEDHNIESMINIDCDVSFRIAHLGGNVFSLQYRMVTEDSIPDFKLKTKITMW